MQQLALVGTGLIGASVGLAAKRAGIDRVVGFDPDPRALELAADRGALDDAAKTLPDAVAGADLAILAAPVAELPAQVAAVLGATPERCTVTDVGSTKGPVCAAAAGAARFIGGHPVCGSEAHGPEHARAELFDGATWFLTPVAATDPQRYRALHGFVTSLGAVPVAVDPAAHDRLLALASHLPHARANPRIWVDIFLDNADALREALGEHRRRVDQLERALATGDAGFLARWIGEAATNRRRLLRGAYPDTGPIERLVVRVPHRPGVLAGITQALGAERINIE